MRNMSIYLNNTNGRLLELVKRKWTKYRKENQYSKKRMYVAKKTISTTMNYRHLRNTREN